MKKQVSGEALKKEASFWLAVKTAARKTPVKHCLK
jgi:hypothetical protein